MSSFRRALLFGFLLWLVAFVVALAIYPIRESSRALFESIMPVVVAAATVTFALLYLRRVSEHHVREAIALGALWFAINVLIDLPLMLTEPIAMTLGEYAADVGLTYLMIPIITVGIGVASAWTRSAPR